MAKKQNKISVNTMDKIIEATKKEPDIITYEVDGESINITVKPYLTLKEHQSFISDIADAVFVNGAYAPNMLNFAYGYNLISYFTNINLPKNVEKINELLASTNIVENIEDSIQYHGFIDEVIDVIEFRKNVYLNNTGTNEFMASLTALTDNLNKAVESGIKDIDPKEVLEVAKNLADKKEDQLVDGILDFEEEKKKHESE